MRCLHVTLLFLLLSLEGYSNCAKVTSSAHRLPVDFHERLLFEFRSRGCAVDSDCFDREVRLTMEKLRRRGFLLRIVEDLGELLTQRHVPRTYQALNGVQFDEARAEVLYVLKLAVGQDMNDESFDVLGISSLYYLGKGKLGRDEFVRITEKLHILCNHDWSMAQATP